MSKATSAKYPVYVVDTNGDESDASCQFPFYTVIKEGKSFMVMYYGSCAIHRSATLGDAKEYIRGKLVRIQRLSIEQRNFSDVDGEKKVREYEQRKTDTGTSKQTTDR